MYFASGLIIQVSGLDSTCHLNAKWPLANEILLDIVDVDIPALFSPDVLDGSCLMADYISNRRCNRDRLSD